MEDVRNRSDCIINNAHSEMKGMQENVCVTGVKGR